MGFRDSKVTATLLAATVVVGGVNIAAYAGGGHAFLLGRHNTEKKASVLKNKHKGAALTIVTKKSSPPLKVNSKKRVKHLNADAVDGKSAGALTTRVTTYVLPDRPGEARTYDVTLSGVRPGYYRVEYAVNLDAGYNRPGHIQCGLIVGSSPLQGASGVDAADSYSFLEHVAFVHVGSVGLHVRCSADDPGVEFAEFDGYVDLTNVNSVAQGHTTLN